MSVEIIQGDALALPLDDASVDLIVTSPPYFGLRSYQDGGEHYDGQIGDEATPAEFVDALIAATREMVRVLKPSGSIWVNLGDKYSTHDNPRNGHGGSLSNAATHAARTDSERAAGVGRRNQYGTVPTKSLIGVPWRYAIRCIDDLGLILRAEVIWSKPNGLPESVTDRVRRSHETWFHFTKRPRYFSAVDEIREAHVAQSWRGGGRKITSDAMGAANRQGKHHGMSMDNWQHPLGKLPGSVWTIATQPLKVPDHLGVDHFAAFPMEWPRRIIRGWSPSGICLECGQGRRPVTRTEPMQWKPSARLEAMREQNPDGLRPTSGTMVSPARHTITGYACGCDEPTADTTPAIVLDPFGGTGTTALVAHALGRHGISVDLSSDYCRLARWRTTDPGEIARARLQPKPKPVPTNQEVLW